MQIQNCAGWLLYFCIALIILFFFKPCMTGYLLAQISSACQGCMLRFNELWQVSLCSNMDSSGFWLVRPAKCGFIGTMWKEAAIIDSSCVTNPLNENSVSFGLVSLWQAWIHPNLPSTWGFPECTHPTLVWSQPASSPQWGASLALICEVCQDLPSQNTARAQIAPSLSKLTLLLLLLNIAVRGVCVGGFCAGGVCSLRNWIRVIAVDVACLSIKPLWTALYCLRIFHVQWADSTVWTDKGFILNHCHACIIAKVIINNNQVYLLWTSLAI